MFLDNQYDAGVPIYLQIMERIKQRILLGEWKSGERIQPVRELAVEFGVNPNTMQRSLAELEREGLLFSERTAGRFVTSDPDRIEELRAQMAQEIMRGFVRQMRSIGLTPDEVLRRLTPLLSDPYEQDKEEKL